MASKQVNGAGSFGVGAGGAGATVGGAAAVADSGASDRIYLIADA